MHHSCSQEQPGARYGHDIGNARETCGEHDNGEGKQVLHQVAVRAQAAPRRTRWFGDVFAIADQGGLSGLAGMERPVERGQGEAEDGGPEEGPRVPTS